MRLFRHIIFALAAAGAALTATAQQTVTVADVVTLVEATDSVATPADERAEAPSIFGGQHGRQGLRHFSWGVDLGTGVDMTANDMSFFSIHAYLGYKSNVLRFLGVGTGMDIMMNNPSRSYPLYAMLRTSFSNRPRLCFLDMRAGVSFNSMFDYKSQTGFYGTLGFGFVLAKGKSFSSHIIIGYTFMPMHDVWEQPEPTPDDRTGAAPEMIRHALPDLHYASIRIGCAF